MKQYDGKILNIMLCSACNTQCKHCYICYKGNFEEKKLEEIIKNFKGEKITLNGTEPMLFPNFLKYFKMVGQDYIFTNSNIIYKNPNMLDKLLNNGIKKVCFSYHYGIQDSISNIPLSQVEKCIELCINKGLKVRLLCSVCKQNMNLLDEFCKKALELNVHEIQLTNFIIQGNAIKNNLYDFKLNDDEILETLKKINELRKKYPKDDLFIDRCGSFGNSINSKNYLCDAGIDDVTITPDLKLYPCIFFAGMKKFEIGYYNNGNFYLTKECKHDCNNCLAKKMFNDNDKNFHFIENIKQIKK